MQAAAAWYERLFGNMAASAVLAALNNAVEAQNGHVKLCNKAGHARSNPSGRMQYTSRQSTKQVVRGQPGSTEAIMDRSCKLGIDGPKTGRTCQFPVTHMSPSGQTGHSSFETRLIREL